jgi:hypothetical protein
LVCFNDKIELKFVVQVVGKPLLLRRREILWNIELQQVNNLGFIPDRVGSDGKIIFHPGSIILISVSMSIQSKYKRSSSLPF